MVKILDLFRSPTFLAKIIQLVFACICVSLFMADTTPFLTSYKSKWAVVYGTYVGFIMINIIIILASLVDNPLNRTMILIITFPAAFLFFAAGGIIIEIWSDTKGSTGQLIGSGILAFITGILYLADFALAFFRYG